MNFLFRSGSDAVVLPQLLISLSVFAARNAPVFQLESREPLPIVGELRSLDQEGLATIHDAAGMIRTATLLRLRQSGVTRPGRPRVPMLLLSNGDLIPGEIVGGDRQALKVRPSDQTDPTVEPWAVPLSLISAFWLIPPPADIPLDPADYSWRENARRQDAVLLRNGDIVLGTVEAIGDGPSLRIVRRPDHLPRVVEFSQIAAVAFDPSLSRAPRVRDPLTRLVTVEGMRLSLKSITADASEIHGETCFGTILRYPLHSVATLEVDGRDAVRLGDLKPRAEISQGFLGISWPRTVNQTVKGRPLCLPAEKGIDYYDYGLGTHPRCRLTYALDKKYRRFVAAVGLDPVTGRAGTAVIRILVDGKEQPIAGMNPLTAGKSPVSVQVNLTGARELTLVVDFGPTGDVQADVNWGDPRLIR